MFFSGFKAYRYLITAFVAKHTLDAQPLSMEMDVARYAAALYYGNGKITPVSLERADLQGFDTMSWPPLQRYLMYAMAMNELGIPPQTPKGRTSWDLPRNPFTLRPEERHVYMAAAEARLQYGLAPEEAFWI